MKNISTFQLVAIGLCILFVIVGVGVFAAFGGLLGGASLGPVTIWGTLDGPTMDNVITAMHAQDKAFESVTYVQKNPATYQSDLLNAMAAGTGPDLFLIGQDGIESFSDKIALVPYAEVSQGQFIGSFIDEGAIFLTPQGALALPFTVDPLVMYWNRDLFASAGLAQAPVYWNDFLNISPKITSLDGTNVRRSAVALGLWQNITNAKAILSSLFMQAGDPLTRRDADGALQAAFGETPQNAPANPAESALRFYTEFANPSKTTYSWNASLKDSQLAFTSGDLAIYFGFASEYPSLAARNPNLHFSAALLPQLQGNSVHITFGNMLALAISRSARNPQGAITISKKITSQSAVSILAQTFNLPPVRRDVAVDSSNNSFASVFVQSSLIARGWLDPNPKATDAMFKSMIESVVSGGNEPAGAIAEGAQALQQAVSQRQ